MTDRAVDWRERKALRHCGAGFVEGPGSFPRGVGRKTLERLAAKGWIEHKTCPTYGTVGYQITEAGEVALYGE